MPKSLGVKNGTQTGDYSLVRRDELTVLEKKFSRTYYVLADTLADEEPDILATSGIPALFSTYNGSVVNSRKAKEISRVTHPGTGLATAIWEVDINYSDEFTEEDNEDPLSLPPTIRWFGENEEEILEKDAITGDAVQTDAEEPMLITAPVVVAVLEIKRYESYPFDQDIIFDYSNHTNSEVFWGMPAGHCLFMPPEADEETIEGTKYAVVTYRLKFKIKPGQTEPWKARVLHHGFKYRETAGAKPTIYKDRHGSPATINLFSGDIQPFLRGTKLPDGLQPHYKEWNRFQKINFNALSLGPF